MTLRKTPFAIAPLLTFAFLAVGCVGTPEGFAKRGAKISCTNFEECQGALFESEYGGDQGECREKVEEASIDSYKLLEDMGCEYQKDKARECIKEANANKKECDADAPSACAEVWDCPDPSMGELDKDDDELREQYKVEAAELAPPIYEPVYYSITQLDE